MRRAILLVLDSFGIGASADAEKFGDQGANTLGHIAEYCAKGQGDQSGVRQGKLNIPNLTQLGISLAAKQSSQTQLQGLDFPSTVTGAYGYAAEISFGKDTPSGHWEMTGCPVLFDWGYFPKQIPCFPDELIAALIQQENLPGVLGNKHASGTEIIQELGDEHIQTGKPIIYTSADSVFQIAAHEEHFGLERLYQVCKTARKLVDDYNIGRVIARPFVGRTGEYIRTANRHDYTTPPPLPTLLDSITTAGDQVHAIGKINDIFAKRGITKVYKGKNNQELFMQTLQAITDCPNGGLVFSNFVDFDTLFGHRRDVSGYANALEEFDSYLPDLLAALQSDDLVIISADHGCDPTWPGSDHTREHIPILAFGPKVLANDIGKRESFADIGQTIAEHLGLKPLDYGKSFYAKIMGENNG